MEGVKKYSPPLEITHLAKVKGLFGSPVLTEATVGPDLFCPMIGSKPT